MCNSTSASKVVISVRRLIRSMLIYPPFMALFQWIGLCLNPDKSESILFGTHQHLRTFPAVPPIKISGTEIKLSDNITSLGLLALSWTPKLTFNVHVTALCRACYFHLGSLRHIRRSLTDDMAKSIAVALVQSRLDYCNSLLFGVSQFNLDKLQRGQNLLGSHSMIGTHQFSIYLLNSTGSPFTHA